KLKNPLNGRGNQAYLLAVAPIYDEWIRNNYELQVWQAYWKMGTEQNHWAKEIVQRTKKSKLITTAATPVIAAPATSPTAATTASTAATTTTNNLKNQVREPIERLENYILEYIYTCTKHVKKMAENKVQLAKAQLNEFKALEKFEQIATPSQWNIHLILKPKIKLWSTKNKNYLAALRRVEYGMPPKFIEKVDLSFKIDESIINRDEAQATYDQMRQITKEFRTKAMTLYVQSLGREKELLLNEIKGMIEGFPQENDQGFDAEPGYAAFKHYHNLRPRFIYNDPKTASRRRTIELATLKRKIEARFFEKKVSPGRPVEQFIAELDLVLQKLHN
ncbi:unnamed protein product, partial [Rotaria sordida]